jgi:hypothetical protein
VRRSLPSPELPSSAVGGFAAAAHGATKSGVAWADLVVARRRRVDGSGGGGLRGEAVVGAGRRRRWPWSARLA